VDAAGVRVRATAVRTRGRLDAERLAALRRRAAVFAAPARYEPFGLAALEAARDRCALVLGDIPSLREVWGAAATYVDPDDPPAIRSALERLLAAPAVARRMGDRAQARAGRYTTAAMARRHAALYRRLERTAVAA
jgi:glycogen synthase